SPERSDSIAPLHRDRDRRHGVPPLMIVTMMLGSITPELHGNVWYSNPLTGSLKTPSMLKNWLRYKMRMVGSISALRRIVIRVVIFDCICWAEVNSFPLIGSIDAQIWATCAHVDSRSPSVFTNSTGVCNST